MKAKLSTLLQEANASGRAVPCFNVFNLAFIKSIISAAEEEGAPVIISLNADMVKHYSLKALVPLLNGFAESTLAPVCPHLDHTYDLAIIKEALELGLHSVMYDGSQLPLAENLATMQEVVTLAKSYQADVEGEIGSVSYADNDPTKAHIKSELTKYEDAITMDEQAGLSALAVSVGNVHRLKDAHAKINFELLDKISSNTTTPLVIHGTSGIPASDLKKIATQTRVAKFNIATDLRKTWGIGMRATLNNPDNLEIFDPLQITKMIELMLKERTKYWINLLR